MGEIKSTYDIVMEKAKGITVSEDEKKEFQMREIRGRVKGLLQKFMDGALDAARIAEELDGFGAEKREMAKELFKEEGAAMLRIQGDNALVLGLLKDIAGVEISKIEEVLSFALSALNEEKLRIEKRLVERFRDKGVSGLAIVPNLDADREWIRIVSEMEDELYRKVEAMM